MRDLGVELMSVQYEQPTDRNQIEATLQQITTTTNTMCRNLNRGNRLDGHRTGLLGKNLNEMRNVVAMRGHGGVGNITKNQNMGAIGSQREIGPYSRNLGLGLEHELAKQEPNYASYAPGLSTVNGNVPEQSSGSKSVSGARKLYDQRVA